MLIKCLHPGECGELADLLEDLSLPGAQGERGRHSEGSCFSRLDGSSAETFSNNIETFPLPLRLGGHTCTKYLCDH